MSKYGGEYWHMCVTETLIDSHAYDNKKIKNDIHRRMAEDIGRHLLKSGVIKIRARFDLKTKDYLVVAELRWSDETPHSDEEKEIMARSYHEENDE